MKILLMTGRRLPRASRPARQRGRTILELMIAMTIAIGVLLGISVFHQSASRTVSVSQQMSVMNDEAPLALLAIGQAVKRAGSGEIIGSGYSNLNQTMFSGPHLRGCRGGSFANPAAGDFTCVAVAGGQDALMVRFQSNSVVGPDQFATRNCVGGLPPNTAIAAPGHPANGALVPIVENVYRVVNETLDCSGNNSVPEALARDVAEFRVYYGFDRDAATLALSGAFGASPRGAAMVTADEVWAAQAAFAGQSLSAWDFVVSVHACMVLRTRESSTSVVAGPFEYQGCPETAAEAGAGTGPTRSAADGTVHRLFTQSFTVRSRATASPSVRLAS